MNSCVVCGTGFEAKRSDAKFCSSTCRSKASREMNDAFVDGTLPEQPDANVEEPVANPVRVKRECKRSDLCCNECVDFESGVHWCPNKGCGCFETREEQLVSIEAFERACDHSSTVMSRCLHCGAVLFTSKADRQGLESLRRFGCGKHNGSFSCGCEEKTVPKKAE